MKYFIRSFFILDLSIHPQKTEQRASAPASLHLLPMRSAIPLL